METFSISATLRDRYKDTWQVEITKYGDDWYLTKGWMDFYQANLLEVGDEILFDYKGIGVFHFKFIGSKECDKERMGGPSLIVTDEEVELDDEEEEANIVDIQQEVEEDTETGNTYGTNNSDAEYVEEESDNSSEEFVRVSKSKAKCKACEQPGSSATQSGGGTIPRKRIKRRRRGPDCYGADIFNSGLICRPKNPFFVTRSGSAGRCNDLPKPKNVVEDFNMSIPVNFHLVDEDGRKWSTRIAEWGDGRLRCTHGWDSLCIVNGIERDMVCICEFVQGEGQEDFCIKVHVVKN